MLCLHGLDSKLGARRNLLASPKRPLSPDPLVPARAVRSGPFSRPQTNPMGRPSFRPHSQIPRPKCHLHPCRPFHSLLPRRREPQFEARRRRGPQEQLHGPLQCRLRQCQPLFGSTPNSRTRRHG